MCARRSFLNLHARSGTTCKTKQPINVSRRQSRQADGQILRKLHGQLRYFIEKTRKWSKTARNTREKAPSWGTYSRVVAYIIARNFQEMCDIGTPYGKTILRVQWSITYAIDMRDRNPHSVQIKKLREYKSELYTLQRNGWYSFHYTIKIVPLSLYFAIISLSFCGTYLSGARYK